MLNATLEKAILSAISEDGGNVSFCKLEQSTGLGFDELSAAIGSLIKDKRILLRINHAEREAYVHSSTSDALYARFMDLLFVYRGKERSVAFYASRLCITPKYLSIVVKKASGKTPSEWIHEESVKAIETMLCHTQASIKEIVYELNFPNPSFFGKFFKAQKGMSPKLYRKTYFQDCQHEAQDKPRL